MKLISLHIENFGGLRDFSMSFSEGLTVLEQPNGFGKTTLAEFIRAMFYGFPRKAKTLEKSLRQKYAPWQGGVYGGNLVFETQGVCYRVERSFGDTPKEDTFTLFDLTHNRASSRYSAELGRELFQMDVESFERSTYLSQLCSPGSMTTASIQAKLTNLVDDSDDMGNFPKAFETLRAARSGFIPFRGSGGTVAQAQGKVSRIQEELAQLDKQQAELEKTDGEIAQTEKALSENRRLQREIRERIRTASEEAGVLAARREYDRLAQRAQALRSERAALIGRYPRGFPTAEELERCGGALRRYRTLLGEAEYARLSEEERGALEQLTRMNASGQLEQQRLEQLENLERELTKARHEQALLAQPEEDALRLQKLEQYFACGIPEEAELDVHRGRLAEAEELREQKAKLLERLAGMPADRKNPLPTVLWMVAVAGLITGGVLLMRSLWLWGGISMSAGLLAMILALVASKRAGQKSNRQMLADAIEETEMKITALEAAVRKFVRCYSAAKQPGDALHEIRENREELLKLREERQETERNQRALDNRVLEMERILTQELGTTDFGAEIRRLHFARDRFARLSSRQTEAERDLRALSAQLAPIRQGIGIFFEKYGQGVDERRCDAFLSGGQKQEHVWKAGEAENLLLQIRDDLRDYEELSRDLAAADAETDAFRDAHRAVLARPAPQVPEDLGTLHRRDGDLSEENDALTDRLAELKQRSRVLTEQLSRARVLQVELERWQEIHRTGREQAALLDAAMDYLQTARDNLRSCYLGPVRSHFLRYMEQLTGECPEQILLTPELEVQLEREGFARQLPYFSAGQTDMVMLCMRFALVDALFPKEKPFVILDDPFVNLDDAHTEQALTILRQLAREKQILYMVCNSSRTPK